MKNYGQALLLILLLLALAATVYCALAISNTATVWILAILFALLIIHTLYDLRLKKTNNFISAEEAKDLDRENGFALDEEAKIAPIKPQIIEFLSSVLMYNMSDYPPKKLTLIPPNIYQAVCVASHSPTDPFWWQIECNGEQYGLPPLEFQALILNNQAKWRD